MTDLNFDSFTVGERITRQINAEYTILKSKPPLTLFGTELFAPPPKFKMRKLTRAKRKILKVKLTKEYYAEKVRQMSEIILSDMKAEGKLDENGKWKE